MTNESIIDILEKLREALEQNKYQESSNLLDNLVEEYEKEIPRESGQVQRYSVARVRGSVDDSERDKLSEYIQSATNMSVRRSGVIGEAQGFVSGVDVDEGSLKDGIDALKKEEQSFKRQETLADGVEVPSALPPIVIISSFKISTNPVPKGKDAHISMTVENVGDNEAQDVQIQFAATDGIALSPENITISKLTDEQTLESTLEAKDAGGYDIKGEAKYNDEVTLETTEVTVISKGEGVNLALGVVQSLRERVENIDLSKPDKKSLTKKLDNCQKKLEKALQFVDDDRPKKANNQLDTAVNIINSFINKLEAINKSKNSSLKEKDYVFLSSRANTSIDKIKTSKESEI